MKKNGEYNIPAVCVVCGKKYMARYNMTGRAAACTDPKHKCQKGKKNGRKVPCLDGCCRSKYYRGLAQMSMDSTIDPRFVLSESEFDRMWKASGHLPDPEGITLRFIASTGCRLEESLIVQRDGLEWMDGPYSIARIPTIKRMGRPVRQVHLSNKSDFADELRKWWKGAEPGPLFPIAKRTLQRALEKILDPIKPNRKMLVHILRHTRASQLIEVGADWNYVRQQLGWARLEMAKRYVHTSKEKIAKVLESIG